MGSPLQQIAPTFESRTWHSGPHGCESRTATRSPFYSASTSDCCKADTRRTPPRVWISKDGVINGHCITDYRFLRSTVLDALTSIRPRGFEPLTFGSGGQEITPHQQRPSIRSGKGTPWPPSKPDAPIQAPPSPRRTYSSA